MVGAHGVERGAPEPHIQNPGRLCRRACRPLAWLGCWPACDTAGAPASTPPHAGRAGRGAAEALGQGGQGGGHRVLPARAVRPAGSWLLAFASSVLVSPGAPSMCKRWTLLASSTARCQWVEPGPWGKFVGDPHADPSHGALRTLFAWQAGDRGDVPGSRRGRRVRCGGGGARHFV